MDDTACLSDFSGGAPLFRNTVAHPRGARPVGIAVTACAALLAGTGPLAPGVASAAPAVPQETVVPAALRSTYTSASFYAANTLTGADGAGSQGFFHRLEGYSGLVWSRYGGGAPVPVPKAEGSYFTEPTGSDVLAYCYPDRVELWDASDGTTRTVYVPEGQSVLSVYGTTVVTFRNSTTGNGTSTRVMHLLTSGPDGTTRDVPVVGAPEDMVLGQPHGADAAGVLFQSQQRDGTVRMVVVDRETGRVQGWTQRLPSGYYRAKISPDHIVVYSSSASTVLVLPRSDVSATPVEVALDSGFSKPGHELALAGRPGEVQRLGPSSVQHLGDQVGPLLVRGADRDFTDEIVLGAGLVAVRQRGELGAGPGAGDDGRHSIGRHRLSGPLVLLGIVRVRQQRLDGGPGACDSWSHRSAVDRGRELKGIVNPAAGASDLVEVPFVDEGQDVGASCWRIERDGLRVSGDPDMGKRLHPASVAPQELGAGGHPLQHLSALLGSAERVKCLKAVDESASRPDTRRIVAVFTQPGDDLSLLAPVLQGLGQLPPRHLLQGHQHVVRSGRGSCEFSGALRCFRRSGACAVRFFRPGPQKAGAVAEVE
ncbi:hypothetical protein [Streptomyces sp. NPDC088816]|uniref:hypothetical protein n=1 Tax=Streptomyces sp. NPDC088816 TaxID=3365906 RepID=UPI0037FA0400